MEGGALGASVRIGRQLKEAFAELLDQSTPFGRLALTQVLMTAGDTLLTVSLAGSLFFSISPQAAKSKVLLYLLLTIAPFGVVAPLLGPLIDKSKGARRLVVVVSAASRGVICLFMARDIHSLLVFPEAFFMLVLSKVYLITKGALVPLLAGTTHETTASTQDYSSASDGLPTERHEEMASLNAKLGLLSSLAGFAASLPAIIVLKLLGGAWVLRMDTLVFIVATVSGLRLPITRMLRGTGQKRTVENKVWRRGQQMQTATGQEESLPVEALQAGAPAQQSGESWADRPTAAAMGAAAIAHPEIVLALTTMSVIKALVGFLTFLLAFSLRRMHAATWWYGFVLGASVAGSIIGVLLVPRARRQVSEQQLLTVAIWLVSVAGSIAAFTGGLPIQAVMALLIGIAGAVGKPSFDALVQRFVPTEEQGRAFARYETRLQLLWVLGALVPVGLSLPLRAGDIVIASVAGLAAISYMTGRSAAKRRRLPPQA